MKAFLSLLFILSTCFVANAKTSDKQKLIDRMVKACKTELAKEPALTDTTDGETVWKNLEDKEHADVKLSKNCDAAHEKYEHKYHKEENETH